jgi:tetratricopeptide (TPR) repeat protein
MESAEERISPSYVSDHQHPDADVKESRTPPSPGGAERNPGKRNLFMGTPATAHTVSASDVERAESPVERQLRIGLAHYGAGRIDDAIACYQQGLAELDSETSGQTPAGQIVQLHSQLGNASMVRGDLHAAKANYEAALRLNPDLTDCLCNLGSVCLKWNRPTDAIALYSRALALDPRHWPSRTNMSQALLDAQQYLIAKPYLQELAAERPYDPQILNRLGKLNFHLDELRLALEYFEQAVIVNPNDSESFNWIGGIRQHLNDTEAAEEAYARAAQLRPLIKYPAAKFPPSFSILALFAPFAGNTPTEFLLKDSPYDANILALFASNTYDPDQLRQTAHVVVNLMSDADQGHALFPLAADLVERIGRPIINHPRKVQQTTRETVASLLQGIAGCRVPKVVRQSSHSGGPTAALEAVASFAMPVLVRPAGTHGGDDFEKVESLGEVAAFMQRHPDSDHYLIEYIDYRSADGYFRKYRFIFVNDEILPYHLAIGQNWKLHHDSTDMVDHSWMQREEETFLNDPSTYFTPGHYEALRAIRQAIGLEYFGIDCGLDAQGQMVVFEVNASMLVHQRNDSFPYKAPFVDRIKQAFDAMLQKVASGHL